MEKTKFILMQNYGANYSRFLTKGTENMEFEEESKIMNFKAIPYEFLFLLKNETKRKLRDLFLSIKKKKIIFRNCFLWSMINMFLGINYLEQL